MADSPLEEIAYIRVMKDGQDGLLEAVHMPYRNPWASHPNSQVRAAYHFGVCRAAYAAAAREGYVV